MNQYRIMKAPLVRPATMTMPRPPLHPNTTTRGGRAAVSSCQQHQPQREATKTMMYPSGDDADLNEMISFLKVTLGFFPAYVNYTKRVSDQPETTTTVMTTTTAISLPEEEEGGASETEVDKEEEAKASEEKEEYLVAAEEAAGHEERQNTARPSSPHPFINDGEDGNDEKSSRGGGGGTTTGEEYAEILCYHHNLPDVAELSDISESETSTATAMGNLEEFIDWYYSTSRGGGGDGEEEEEEKIDIGWNTDDDDDTGTTGYWSSNNPEFVRLLDMIEREFSSWNIM